VTEVNIHEAKTHLSRLLEKVQQGDEVIIAKAGTPIAKLVKIDKPSPRKFGTAKGMVKFHPGWNDPMTEEDLSKFLGE
jgi:prevent-host-death family protein